MSSTEDSLGCGLCLRQVVSVQEKVRRQQGLLQTGLRGAVGPLAAPWSQWELGEPGDGGLTSPPASPTPAPAEGLEGGLLMRLLQTALLGNLRLSQQISRLMVFSSPFPLSRCLSPTTRVSNTFLLK